MQPAAARHVDAASPVTPMAKCRLCSNLLRTREGDDFELQACARCKTSRPNQLRRQLDRDGVPVVLSDAERAVVGRLHGLMPADQLLEVLNGRREADHPALPLLSVRDLAAEVECLQGRAQDNGWVSLRRVIAEARRQGVLDRVTTEVIDDFAVAFQLTRGQVLHLKDVLLSSEGED